MFEKIIQAPRRFTTFVTEARSELRKVTFPSKKEVYSTTLIVILAVFFFGFYLALVDLGLQHVVEMVFEQFR